MCRREGCWLTKHSEEERRKSRAQYKAKLNKQVDSYLQELEDDHPKSDEEQLNNTYNAKDIKALLLNINLNNNTSQYSDNFITIITLIPPQQA